MRYQMQEHERSEDYINYQIKLENAFKLLIWLENFRHDTHSVL